MATQSERPTLDQAAAILHLIQEKETPHAQITRLLASGYLADLLDADLNNAVDRETFRQSLGAKPLWLKKAKQLSFRITINYSEPLERKFADGLFGFYVGSQLNDDNFAKVVGDGEVETDALLVNFGKDESVNSDEAAARLDKLGLRPGIPKELIDLARFYTNVIELAALRFVPTIPCPAVALGDSWTSPGSENHFVMCLHSMNADHPVELLTWDVEWNGSWWFLAFCK